MTLPTPITTADVRSAAQRTGLPLTDAEIETVRQAVASLRESAVRLRRDLRRNDEPAFGYRHPVDTGRAR